jgi:hypothetical protein
VEPKPAKGMPVRALLLARRIPSNRNQTVLPAVGGGTCPHPRAVTPPAQRSRRAVGRAPDCHGAGVWRRGSPVREHYGCTGTGGNVAPRRRSGPTFRKPFYSFQMVVGLLLI